MEEAVLYTSLSMWHWWRFFQHTFSLYLYLSFHLISPPKQCRYVAAILLPRACRVRRPRYKAYSIRFWLFQVWRVTSLYLSPSLWRFLSHCERRWSGELCKGFGFICSHSRWNRNSPISPPCWWHDRTLSLRLGVCCHFIVWNSSL